MGNRRLIIYYLGNLLMMSVKTGNLTGAYKYASDFVKLDLVGDDLKRDFEDLANQFKLRLEERLNIPPRTGGGNRRASAQGHDRGVIRKLFLRVPPNL